MSEKKPGYGAVAKEFYRIWCRNNPKVTGESVKERRKRCFKDGGVEIFITLDPDYERKRQHIYLFNEAAKLENQWITPVERDGVVVREFVDIQNSTLEAAIHAFELRKKNLNNCKKSLQDSAIELAFEYQKKGQYETLSIAEIVKLLIGEENVA
jgi:hypothetical protein